MKRGVWLLAVTLALAPPIAASQPVPLTPFACCPVLANAPDSQGASESNRPRSGVYERPVDQLLRSGVDERPVNHSPVVRASDAFLRAALAGQWAWQFADDRTRNVIYIETRRAADGTWSEAAIERTRDGERSVYVRSGRWFVTEGVLKTRTTRVDGFAVGINSRLAFQTYPIVAIDARRVIYRVPKENGHPGQWPRVIEPPTELRDRVPTVIETRVDR